LARLKISDYLQAFHFWMMDVGPIGLTDAPVFTPLLGFASITSPDITSDVFTFREGNYSFERHAIKGASIGGFSVSRAVSFYDSDFWSWVMDAVTGHTLFQVGGPTPRRDFVLIHYFPRSPIPLPYDNTDSQVKDIAIADIGPFELSARIPARAYVLSGCIPTRWKSGSDFDASSSAISIAELDFVCESVELVDVSSLVKNAVNKLL
jgi:phage tail-like protein